ncbi:MAG TPA: L-threonylcarbamoyladenylate synthase [Steroidobacteraceae bacterium]|jgi:tRNA threonylcarbamoyl adenosine modification protein (Sua5/YciO/YrdC/YwlC family)|nr:L-threonylcarbamoyladenylate synthase [Steroidobacteraceae bacterium]
MSIHLQLHPVSPQRRFLRQAADVLRAGGVIVYPTDSCYALGCHIGDKAALERIRAIRQTDRNHNFTLVCRDLADVGKYAVVENWQYRLLRAHTPGPYTFILKASRETPRRLKHERHGTIGLRVPDHPVTQLLLAELGEPVMSSTLLLPGEDLPRTDAREIYEKLEHSVDLVLDGGNCGLEPTSVIDLSTGRAVIAREGRGDVGPFQA